MWLLFDFPGIINLKYKKPSAKSVNSSSFVSPWTKMDVIYLNLMLQNFSN